MKKSNGLKVFTVLNYLLFVAVILICLLPVIHVIFASVSDPAWVISQKGLIWRIKGFTLNGYKLVFQNRTLLISYLNTFFYVFTSTFIGTFVTVMAAYALSRKEFLLGNTIMFFITFSGAISGRHLCPGAAMQSDHEGENSWRDHAKRWRLWTADKTNGKQVRSHGKGKVIPAPVRNNFP